jgi:arylsulfatase A-like enzyme
MMKRTQFQAIVLMAVGSMVGYAAASGQLTAFCQAQGPSQPRESPPTEEPRPTCCSEGTDRGLLLAKADGHEARPQSNGQPGTDGRKPNILVIWGDDIGLSNISAYSDGLMGYTTPNIDRIAKDGIRFLHYYGEQSCTAGRAAFLTGQHGLRTGMTKVGFPGAPMGMSQLDPSIGGLLKNLGYSTGQFGKNHVGDRNPSLPTVNGFDEFFGNLYHLNAEEEPELPDYPSDPAYRAKFGPRGVLKCKATDKDDPTVDPRFGKIGKQIIEDTGALTKKRMETIDD